MSEPGMYEVRVALPHTLLTELHRRWGATMNIGDVVRSALLLAIAQAERRSAGFDERLRSLVTRFREELAELLDEIGWERARLLAELDQCAAFVAEHDDDG